MGKELRIVSEGTSLQKGTRSIEVDLKTGAHSYTLNDAELQLLRVANERRAEDLQRLQREADSFAERLEQARESVNEKYTGAVRMIWDAVEAPLEANVSLNDGVAVLEWTPAKAE